MEEGGEHRALHRPQLWRVRASMGGGREERAAHL